MRSFITNESIIDVLLSPGVFSAVDGWTQRQRELCLMRDNSLSSGRPHVFKQSVIEANLLLEQTDRYGVIEVVCETSIFVEIESRDEDVERQRRERRTMTISFYFSKGFLTTCHLFIFSSPSVASDIITKIWSQTHANRNTSAHKAESFYFGDNDRERRRNRKEWRLTWIACVKTSGSETSRINTTGRLENRFNLLSDLQPLFNYAVVELREELWRQVITFHYLLSFNPEFYPRLITRQRYFLNASRFITAVISERSEK